MVRRITPDPMSYELQCRNAQSGAGLLPHLPQLRESGSSPFAPEFGTFPVPTDQTEISSPAATKSNTAFPTPLDGQTLLHLSWSHLIEFIRLEDPWKRASSPRCECPLR